MIVAIKEVASLFSAMLRFCLVGSVSVRGGGGQKCRLDGYQGHACQPSEGPPPQYLTMVSSSNRGPYFECEPADGIHPHTSHDGSETFLI